MNRYLFEETYLGKYLYIYSLFIFILFTGLSYKCLFLVSMICSICRPKLKNV